MAWNIGVLTALSTPRIDGLSTQTKSHVPFNVIFSDYNSLTNTITIYQNTILEYFLPNVPDNFSKFSSYNNAVNLLKLHEYFHYLQCSNFNGLDVFRMNCLNEIAAYSFTQKICGISFE